MEYESPDTPRIGPPITVESGDPLGPAPVSSRAQSVGCRHRLQWRDLSFTAKFRVALHLACSLAALVVAVVCLVDGANVLRTGFDSSDALLILRGGVELILFPLLMVGPLAYLRLWQSPHRPRTSTIVNDACACLMLSVLLFLTAEGREWMMLLALPTYMVGAQLRVLRRTLTGRSACSADPAMPIALRMMTTEGDSWPVTDEQRTWMFGPRVVAPGFDSWRCPHALFWGDMRRIVKLEWLVWAIAESLYMMSLALTFSVLFMHGDQLFAAIPNDWRLPAPFVVFALLSYQLHLANHAGRNSRLLHRGDLVEYVHGSVGHILIAVLAAVIALELGRPYFWAVTVLALTQAYWLIIHMVVQTPRMRCEAEPELHRIAQTALKPGRGRAPFLSGEPAQ